MRVIVITLPHLTPFGLDLTDRKFNPQSTPTQYAQYPHLSSTTLCYPKPTMNFRSKTAFVRCSQRFDTRNRRKIHIAYNPDLAAQTTRRRRPLPAPARLRAAAPATFPNSAAPLDASHSALAAGVDTPRPAASTSCAYPKHASRHARNTTTSHPARAWC